MSEDISPVDVHVGLRIRLRRTERGLSVQKFAEVFSKSFRPISWQQIQKYERGLNRVTAGRLWELALFFDVSIGWFFEGMAQEGRANMQATSITQGATKMMRLYDRLSPTQQSALRTVAKAMTTNEGNDG